jgi:hypothetical protein
MTEVLNFYKLCETWGSYRGVEDPSLWDGTLLQMISKTIISNNHSASLQDQALLSPPPPEDEWDKILPNTVNYLLIHTLLTIC